MNIIQNIIISIILNFKIDAILRRVIFDRNVSSDRMKYCNVQNNAANESVHNAS